MTVTDPQPCFICRRRDCGLGLLRNKSPRWVCEDCMQIAPKANSLSPRQFDACEHDAIDDAMCASGQFMDEVGTTDLAQLDPSHFHLFGVRFLRAFGDSMRKRIADHQAPF